MTDRDPRQEEWLEEPTRIPLAPRVEEYLRTSGEIAGCISGCSSSSAPGWVEDVIAEYFEEERKRAEKRRLIAKWWEGRRRGLTGICTVYVLRWRKGESE